MNRGYWLTPDAIILDLGAKRHIDMVIDAPDKFGEDIEVIRQTYSQFNEALGHEGEARDVIMQRVLARGYIRVRETRNCWKIQLYNFDHDKYLVISLWARFISNVIDDRFADVWIMDINKHPTRWIYSNIRNVMEQKIL